MRYGNLVPAARRHYGSWSRAVIDAGFDPQRMRRSPTWSRERIIEAILTRTLRNESLERRSVQDRNLVDAATRMFGSWRAAVAVANMGSMPDAASRQEGGSASATTPNPEQHRYHRKWTDEQILASIVLRHRNNLSMRAVATYKSDPTLYRAALRRYGRWLVALHAAGLNPFLLREAPAVLIQGTRNEAAADEAARLLQTEKRQLHGIPRSAGCTSQSRPCG